MALILRPFEERDFAPLISWLRRPTSWSGSAARFRHPLDGDQLRRHLQSATGSDTLETFTVTRDGRTVAHVELGMIWPHLSCRLSRVLVAPGERGRGVRRGRSSATASTGSTSGWWTTTRRRSAAT